MACRLPDGSFWPEVQEGMHQVDHGIVICKLCQRHHKANNFAGEGYRFAELLVTCNFLLLMSALIASAGILH